ncbi:MAG: tetratricopeptide repeat protein [Syntrophales bacterium]|jgi:tetratricopeptide (TPR) repeat protein|nr:tetratricopeptide repeat protein [Syntrophales bacterium]MCK9527410.1 tetratricopeptide repeat protein [Syntrophales bacterium]MDX9921512.1 tetratricopeptide repeat protein [Syntrophales bacterium]
MTRAAQLFRHCGLVAVLVVPLVMASACATDYRNREMAEMHLRTGIASIESGQFTEALRELFEARRLNPDDPRVYYHLGVSYYARGMRGDALSAFIRAVELRPDYSEALNYLGLIRFEEKDYSGAISYFQKALENILYDTPEFSLFNMGRAWREQRADDRALSFFEEAARVRPNRILPLVLMNMGTLLLTMDRPDEALKHLRESVRMAPYVADFRYALGEAFLAKGMTGDAVRELRRAIDLAPESEAATKARTILAILPPPDAAREQGRHSH